MEYPVDTINWALSLGTIILQVITVFLIFVLVYKKTSERMTRISLFLREWGLHIALATTLGGVVISLFYSQVLGFAPCSLCWFQRVFLYPQVILFSIASLRNDLSIAIYSISFSIVGGIIALYQHYLQMGGAELFTCTTTSAQSLDCSERFLFEFGYITFPLMAFSLFAFLIVLMLFAYKKGH